MTSHDLLTKEEMSSLLDNSDSGTSESGKRRRVLPYNFRRPDRIPREQIRSLYLMHDLFAHSLSSSLPILMRTMSAVTLMSVEQQAYSEYLQGLADPTALFTLSMHPLPGVAALELSPSVAFPVIDRLLGGVGQDLDHPRAVTEIEQRILEGFLKVVTDDLRTTWKPLADLDLQILGRETRPQMLQIVAPNEAVLMIVFQVQIADARGTMSLCLPAITLEPIIQSLNQSVYSRSREVPPEQTRALLDILTTVRFPVSAELRGTKAAMDDLLNLSPGDVLRLDHRVDQPIEVSIGGTLKFRGDLVAQERRTVVNITSLGDEA
ncbi:MAG: flagellar motor switch protein FliM [Acidobacteria bacterium]|nr:flagellar motor switch protein FliM [Acidobacteriota bacterium]